MRAGTTAATAAADAPLWRRWELPTLAVAAAIYLGWGALTWWYHALPWWLVLPLGGYLLAWHGSLQHEAVHGRPFGRLAAQILVFPSLWLWLPFTHYRWTHLTHHRDEDLTWPGVDPESNYMLPERWVRLHPAQRAFFAALRTLAGRMVLGPPYAVAMVWWNDARAILRGDRAMLRHWLGHIPGAAVVVAWVAGVCDIPLGAYFLLFVYPGIALTLLRSYGEHVPDRRVAHRTAITEAEAPLALLFLNNNLHVVHHADPRIAWYDLPAAYRAGREAYRRSNGGLVYRGYREIARRFLFARRDGPVHPEPGVFGTER